jgi:hypothetical protein
MNDLKLAQRASEGHRTGNGVAIGESSRISGRFPRRGQNSRRLSARPLTRLGSTIILHAVVLILSEARSSETHILPVLSPGGSRFVGTKMRNQLIPRIQVDFSRNRRRARI